MTVDLSIVSRSSSSVSKFIKEDLRKVLSELELYAASEALRKSKIAISYQSQLWSAINHLETAEIATVSSSKSISNKLFFLEMAHSHSKRNYILIIMSLIYFELGEHELCEDAICKLKSREFDSGLIHFLFIPSVVWGIPKMAIKTVYDITFKGHDTQPWGVKYSLEREINKISAQIRAINATRRIAVGLKAH